MNELKYTWGIGFVPLFSLCCHEDSYSIIPILRLSDRYDDIQLDWIDAKVAQVLCPGGVANYQVVDPAVTREFICEFVAPNIAAVFGIQLAFLFGKAILWLAYSEHKELLLPELRECIVTAYKNSHTIEDDVNPIEK